MVWPTVGTVPVNEAALYGKTLRAAMYVTLPEVYLVITRGEPHNARSFLNPFTLTGGIVGA